MNKETDPWKEAFRKKLVEETPIYSTSDSMIWNKVLAEIEKSKKKQRNYIYYWAAASIIIATCFGIASYFSLNYQDTIIISQTNPMASPPYIGQAEEEEEEIKIIANEIEEIKTLEEKKTENKEIVKDTEIRTVANEQILTKTLSDGSLVTLNQKTTLTTKPNFTSKRELALHGEAYFEVFPNKSNPFIVNFGKHKLIVLGTKFSIFQPNDSIAEVSVTEGIVKVFVNANASGTELHAGEQLKIKHNVATLIKGVETSNYIRWIDENYQFTKISLTEVAHVISRKFNKEIVVAPVLNNCKFTGDLTGLNFEESLEIISMSSSASIEKIGTKIYLTGKPCE